MDEHSPAGVIESVIVEREQIVGIDPAFPHHLMATTAYQVKWVNTDGRGRSHQQNCMYAIPTGTPVALGLRFPITANNQHIATVWVNHYDDATIRVGDTEYPIPIHNGLTNWAQKAY